MNVFECSINYALGIVASDGAGKIVQLTTVQPSASYTDWSSFALIFDLYKLEGGNIHYEPFGKYQQSNSVGSCLAGIVYDPDNTTLSWAILQGYDRFAPKGATRLKLFNTADSMTYDYSVPKELIAGPSTIIAANSWLNTGNPISQGVVGIVSDSSLSVGVTKNVGQWWSSLRIKFAVRQ